MAKTLIGSKPVLQADLFKAFYDAYMTQFAPSLDSDGGAADGEANSKMKQKATNFSQKLSVSMADAIYKFVKEISIQATVTGVVAPSGPCSGMIPPTNFKVS